MRNKNPGTGNTTTGAIAKWYGRYAAKIDNLPVLNVDPELVNYASAVSNMLRQSETAMRDIGPNSRLAADSVGMTYNTYSYARPVGVTWAGAYGSYGWANVADRSSQQINQINASHAERMRGFSTANSIMQNVDEATGQIRKQMSLKHNLEF